MAPVVAGQAGCVAQCVLRADRAVDRYIVSPLARALCVAHRVYPGVLRPPLLPRCCLTCHFFLSPSRCNRHDDSSRSSIGPIVSSYLAAHIPLSLESNWWSSHTAAGLLLDSAGRCLLVSRCVICPRCGEFFVCLSGCSSSLEKKGRSPCFGNQYLEQA